MMEVTLSDGSFVAFVPGEFKKFKGLRIPGSVLSQHSSKLFTIYKFDYDQPLFHYSLLHFHCPKATSFTIRSHASFLRFHTVVQGELQWEVPQSPAQHLQAGAVIPHNTKVYRITLPPGETIFFVVSVTSELIAQTAGGEQLIPGKAVMMSPAMQAILQRIFNNPYDSVSRKGLYDISTRELLFHHIATPDFVYEDVYLAKERSTVYAAAQLIASDLGVHYTIAELAQRMNSNVKVIKRGFQRIYGMGPFEYRLQLKMELAQQLLSSTDKMIKEIALDAGYDDSTAFVREFRNQFGISPRLWRLKSRGMGEE